MQVLRDILKEVQSNMVPRSMLKEWALHTFPNATDYWTFRKMFTIQLALIGFAEFIFHLNRLNPEMLQIAQVCCSLFILLSWIRWIFALCFGNQSST